MAKGFQANPRNGFKSNPKNGFKANPVNGFRAGNNWKVKQLRIIYAPTTSFPTAGPKPWSDSIAVPTNAFRKPTRRGFKR